MVLTPDNDVIGYGRINDGLRRVRRVVNCGGLAARCTVQPVVGDVDGFNGWHRWTIGGKDHADIINGQWVLWLIQAVSQTVRTVECKRDIFAVYARGNDNLVVIRNRLCKYVLISVERSHNLLGDDCFVTATPRHKVAYDIFE